MSVGHVNFNVYIDKVTGERLERLAKTKRTTRNALVREALARLLERGVKSDWPREVSEFRGIPGVRPFESARRRLGSPSNDPLA
jgi:Ribbon-helix-helix protein, copG family